MKKPSLEKWLLKQQLSSSYRETRDWCNFQDALKKGGRRDDPVNTKMIGETENLIDGAVTRWHDSFYQLIPRPLSFVIQRLYDFTHSR